MRYYWHSYSAGNHLDRHSSLLQGGADSSFLKAWHRYEFQIPAQQDSIKEDGFQDRIYLRAGTDAQEVGGLEVLHEGSLSFFFFFSFFFNISRNWSELSNSWIIQEEVKAQQMKTWHCQQSLQGQCTVLRTFALRAGAIYAHVYKVSPAVIPSLLVALLARKSASLQRSYFTLTFRLEWFWDPVLLKWAFHLSESCKWEQRPFPLSPLTQPPPHAPSPSPCSSGHSTLVGRLQPFAWIKMYLHHVSSLLSPCLGNCSRC